MFFPPNTKLKNITFTSGIILSIETTQDKEHVTRHGFNLSATLTFRALLAFSLQYQDI